MWAWAGQFGPALAAGSLVGETAITMPYTQTPTKIRKESNHAVSCDEKPNPQLGASRFRHQQADALRISPRTVERMIHLPAFQEELDRLGYQGERRFRKAQRAQRDDERTQKPEYQKVKQLWEEMTDIPEHGRAKVIADREDIKASYDTVRRWCRDWRHK